MSHRSEARALVREELDTPVGVFTILADSDGAIHAAGWSSGHGRMARLLDCPSTRVRDPSGISSAFAAYFAGDRDALDALVVAPAGTKFQRAVWTALRGIPYGSTLSYGELARRIGNPRAVRAVGLANGANPIAVVVPCHRVIGANGTLTGYAGGLDRKQWLLELEHAIEAR